MIVAIRKDQVEVETRLNQLGMTRDELLAIVSAMVAARRGCTKDDPPAAAGWSSWHHGIRRSRQIYRQKGWVRDETDQLSSVSNRKLGVRLTVCNTDDGTSLEDRTPQNRSRKGAATDKAANDNQGSFMSQLDASVTDFVTQTDRIGNRSIVTWYLLVYTDGDDVCAELSCPFFIEDGFFKGFRERIFLLGGDAGSKVERIRDDNDDDGEEFPVVVTRK